MHAYFSEMVLSITPLVPVVLSMAALGDTSRASKHGVDHDWLSLASTMEQGFRLGPPCDGVGQLGWFGMGRCLFFSHIFLVGYCVSRQLFCLLFSFPWLRSDSVLFSSFLNPHFIYSGAIGTGGHPTVLRHRRILRTTFRSHTHTPRPARVRDSGAIEGPIHRAALLHC